VQQGCRLDAHIATISVKNYGNKAAEYVGWSFVSNYGNPPDRKLKQVDVKILDEEQCSNFNTNYKGVVTSGVICSVKAANSSEPCGVRNVQQSIDKNLMYLLHL
jgi:subtilisin family serine protease